MDKKIRKREIDFQLTKKKECFPIYEGLLCILSHFHMNPSNIFMRLMITLLSTERVFFFFPTIKGM